MTINVFPSQPRLITEGNFTFSYLFHFRSGFEMTLGDNCDLQLMI